MPKPFAKPIPGPGPSLTPLYSKLPTPLYRRLKTHAKNSHQEIRHLLPRAIKCYLNAVKEGWEK